jgi:hypothetical protein
MATEELKQPGETEQTAADHDATKARVDSERPDRMSRSLLKDINPGKQKPANVR